MATNYNTVDILPCQTLYVYNLNDQIHVEVLKKLLYELFVPYGIIVDIVARRTKTLRGQAFVVFSEISSATAALKGLNGRKVLNKVLKIEYAKNRSYKTLKPSDYYKMSKANRAKLKHVSDLPEDLRSSLTDESHALFVQNIPHDMSKESLELLFKQYPGFRGCRFIEGRFVAFVDYSMASQAEIALEGLNGFRVSHTHALQISLAN
ncbi:RNA recognition motif family protein [Theileria parva strain Muguga]|uniref:U2 small nuclear ribonucleoprotein B, putative n=1 Tax=Theileria parva TaxID=5875 RepID=Q4N5B3_THEPA|nr:RNA recognition motif family protein [Theileria parva strain Muguga]EAN32660.1 RNA recognition motif family protein [Theileria parva strain Muguga]|eukprot:XP_764943.1 U2 small nuclear ribonucleoprotein B [Theileria parva strain Muguga]